ncbi:MAG TPA: hypothetical protein VJ418_17215 [Streptosporangiaceae bacterium]|nr:hypothetical protein [Streptosporangiaceae bacterium]
MNSRPASVLAGGRSDDRSESELFHIIFEMSTPFGVVALSRTARL